MADSSVPTKAEADKMRAELTEKRKQAAEAKAYEKSRVYPDTPPTVNKKKGGSIRGGGCEIKGKTKGKFV
mgnify:CR=1 FL=1